METLIRAYLLGDEQRSWPNSVLEIKGGRRLGDSAKSWQPNTPPSYRAEGLELSSGRTGHPEELLVQHADDTKGTCGIEPGRSQGGGSRRELRARP